MYELGTALRRRGGDEVIICGYANQLTVFRRRVTGVSVEQKRQAQDRFFGRLPELVDGARSKRETEIVCGFESLISHLSNSERKPIQDCPMYRSADVTVQHKSRWGRC